MLKELFLGLIVVLSVLLFMETISIIKYFAILGMIYGVITLIPLIPKKKEEVK